MPPKKQKKKVVEQPYASSIKLYRRIDGYPEARNLLLSRGWRAQADGHDAQFNLAERFVLEIDNATLFIKFAVRSRHRPGEVIPTIAIATTPRYRYSAMIALLELITAAGDKLFHPAQAQETLNYFSDQFDNVRHSYMRWK
jgi:hypothetical protein